MIKLAAVFLGLGYLTWFSAVVWTEPLVGIAALLLGTATLLLLLSEHL